MLNTSEIEEEKFEYKCTVSAINGSNCMPFVVCVIIVTIMMRLHIYYSWNHHHFNRLARSHLKSSPYFAVSQKSEEWRYIEYKVAYILYGNSAYSFNVENMLLTQYAQNAIASDIQIRLFAYRAQSLISRRGTYAKL